MSGFQDNIVKFKNNKKYMTILYVVIAIAFIAFFLYQVFKINYEPVKTEVALEKTVSASAVTQAFIVRDEYPIEASVTGTLVPLVEDGKRVASGDNVAVVFTSDEAAKTYNEIKELEKKIEYYASLQNKVGVQTADITPLDERIYSSCGDFVAAVSSGKIDTLDSFEEKVRDAITSRQLSTGAVIDPSIKLSELTTQLEQLKAKNIGYSTITAPHPGYYISVADGYESAVAYADVPELRTADAMAVINNPQKSADTEKYMCKLVDGFNWYFVCIIDYDDAVKLTKGESVDVAFTMTTAEPLKATVVNIADTVDHKTAVILKSNLMNTEYAGLRNEQIRITFDKHTGYQISNKAIREVDGQKGVFVLNGNIVKFKKINIAYSDSEYSICNNPENEGGFVELYDEVIVEGVDLYDGKIID